MFVKEVVKGFTLEVLSTSEDDIGYSWTYDIQPKISISSLFYIYTVNVNKQKVLHNYSPVRSIGWHPLVSGALSGKPCIYRSTPL